MSPHQRTPPDGRTRHIVLSVVAHVVDVYDSLTPDSPDDQPVQDPVHYAKTRPCPPCVGALLTLRNEVGADVRDDELHEVRLKSCLLAQKNTLLAMLLDATYDIMEQTNGWEATGPRHRSDGDDCGFRDEDLTGV